MEKEYKFKGDAPCKDCGRKYNPIWFIDNVFWNSVMKENVRCEEARGAILCPICFMARAEKKFDCSWRIIPDWKWIKKSKVDKKLKVKLPLLARGCKNKQPL